MNCLRAFLLILLIFITGLAEAQTGSMLRTPYQPSAPKGSAAFYLEDIASRTGIQISYSDELVKRRRRVKLTGGEQTVEDVLKVVLNGTGLTAVERGGKILLIPATEEASPAPKSITISGIVKDSSSREVLIGAYVYIPSLNTGTSSNTYGFYSLSVPPGSYDIITASGGYRADTSRINPQNDLRRDILLPYGLALAGVTVSSKKEAAQDHTHLTLKDIVTHAGLVGENDVLRALQHVPGVQTGTDGTSSIIVRGGDPGQNLNLLDGVPLYYIDHFYGITSVFNTDAVKSVDFYKGAFPSRYGGRLSSIIDVSSRDGNMERISGAASLGLLKGSLTLEGPIVKEKASMMVSARRTWIDALWRPFFDEFGIDFYDINAKANYIINKNNRVYASFYTGRDQFRIRFYEMDSRSLWGNTIGSARWTTIINPRLFINTTATYSYFRYGISDADPTALPDSAGNRPQYSGKSTINDAALKVQADYYLSAKHHIQAGLHFAHADFSPASATYGNSVLSGFDNTLAAARFSSNELIGYAEDELKLSSHWLLRGGLHWATWLSESYSYTSLQPRLYACWKPEASQNVFASATKMSQFLHLLSSNTSALPADFWVPSTSQIKPEHAWLYALGYSKKLKGNIEATAEIYYKDIRDIVTYKGGSNIFGHSPAWQETLTQGKGWSYGAELSARGNWGPFNASLAYTLSETWRQFALLNNGDPFPYRYDRRHNLGLELIYTRKKRFNAIASWTYMSGEAITLPDQIYPDFDNNVLGNPMSNSATYHYSARNNYRLPPIHRLDVAINFILRRGAHFERTWTLGMFNAYAQKNIMAVDLVQSEQGQYSLRGLSVFQCIPTISYSVKF